HFSNAVLYITEAVSSPVRIESVTIRHGIGGVDAVNADVIAMNCIISQNTISGPTQNQRGGGIRAESNSLFLCTCTITDNVLCDTPGGEHNEGGGIYADDLVAINCTISGNSIGGDHSYGGGVSAQNAEIINCLITRNSASYAGGILHTEGMIRNSTIIDNENIDIGATSAVSRMTVDSSIIGQAGFSSTPGSILELNYSCYTAAAAAVVIGPGSFSDNPMFTTGPGGHHYLSNTAAGQANTSPCVDTGNPETPSSETGSTRTDHVPDTGIIDMGYHYDYHVPAPSPTPAATETPTPTPTPECDHTGVSVRIDPTTIIPGEPFSVTLEACNATQDVLGPVRLYVALEVAGILFFRPAWTLDYTYELTPLDPGLTNIPILEFVWPVTGTTGNASFLTLMTNETGSEALGTWGLSTFDW
ncbi:hypothetical protein JXA80_06240, partial [bacterium]|nr:hypothetical protein [candidate division CSSED10-310 bacterium]